MQDSLGDSDAGGGLSAPASKSPEDHHCLSGMTFTFTVLIFMRLSASLKSFVLHSAKQYRDQCTVGDMHLCKPSNIVL